jgi:hypothetical protein
MAAAFMPRLRRVRLRRFRQVSVGAAPAVSTTLFGYEYSQSTTGLAAAQLQLSASDAGIIYANIAVLLPPCPVLVGLQQQPTVSRWGSMIALSTSESVAFATCAPTAPTVPSWETLSVAIGKLPDGHYTLRWSGTPQYALGGLQIAFDTQLTFTIRNGELIVQQPVPVPTLSWPLLSALALVLALLGLRHERGRSLRARD